MIDFRHIMAWLIFLIWAGVFGIFYFSGEYVEFLNPQFSWLMISGFVLCISFFAVLFLLGPTTSSGCCGHENHNHAAGPSVLRMLILLVPVLFAMNYGSWQLGSFAFDKRAVGLTRVGGTNDNAARRTDSAVTQPGDSASGTVALLPDDGRVNEVTLVEIHNRFEQLAGKKVSTQGMFMSETPGLPDNSWVIFRFLVVCCAADAQPMAVMIKGTRPVGVPDESWLKIDGTLKSIELNGQPALVIEAEKVSQIDAPGVPYMVPNSR